MMKEKETRQTEDMTQLLEIINAKGDTGELQEIVNHHEKLVCNDELFDKELRVIVEDGAREE
jgi:hypothetical protein